MKMEEEYWSDTIKKMFEEMENDPWYIKLKRWLSVRIWIIECNLFNNKFFRKLKKK
jgi:hypothetical protein